MLVLKVRDGDGPIYIGDDVRVHVLKRDKEGVKLGIEAPEGVSVDRECVRLAKLKEGGE